MIKNWLKQLFKDYPAFFIPWCLTVGKTGVSPLLSVNAKACVTGFQRSGNTFLTYLLTNHVIPKEHLIHHFHTIAAVKIAGYRNIPVFILIRDPADSIVSYYLMSFAQRGKKTLPEAIDQNLLENLTREYSRYYAFVDRHIPENRIIFFEEVMENPIQVLEKIHSTINPHVKESPFNEKEVNEAINTYKEKKERQGNKQGAFMSGVPNEDKKAKKQELKEVVQKLESFKQAQDVYFKIRDKRESGSLSF